MTRREIMEQQGKAEISAEHMLFLIAWRCLTYGLLVWLDVVMRDLLRISAISMADGFLIAVLIGGILPRGRETLIACFATGIIAQLLAGTMLWPAVALAGAGILQASIVHIVLGRDMRTVSQLGSMARLLRFVAIAGVGAPVVSAMIPGMVLAPPGGWLSGAALTRWALSEGLGNLVLTPLVLILIDRVRHPRPISRRAVIDWTAVMLAGTLLTAAVFFQNRYPFLFLASPFVMLAAFRLGVAGAAAGTLIVALISAVGTALDRGPIHLVQGTLDEKTLVLQLFLLSIFASALPLAAALGRLSNTQRALRESRDFLGSTLDNMREVVFRADGQGRWTFLNPAWERITGYPVEEALGRPAMDWLVEEDRDRAETIFPEIAEHGREEVVLEMRFRRKDGEARVAEATLRTLRDAGGGFLGTIGNIRDVTDQRLALDALAARERELAFFAANITDAVFRLSLDGICLFVTPSVREILGYDAEVMVGARMLSRFHPDDERAIRETFGGLADGSRDRAVLAYRARRARGDGWIWLEANCQLVRDPETQAPIEIMASLRDISERKALEEELRRERERAESATLAKSRFLANMSHEIRTPMNGVLGFADLLLTSELSPVQRQHAQLIVESSRAMMDILNDILDHSKIEAGELSIADEPVDVRHALRRVSRLFEAAAQKKGLSLTCRVDDAVPRWIRGDGLRLRQILTNLVSNAIKFTDQGGVAIRARVAGPAEAKLLVLEVADTGMGIAVDRLDAIFGLFVQENDDIARTHGGTGLGLSISRMLARLMGGTLAVASMPGEGSRFDLTLPLVEADVDEPVAIVPDQGVLTGGGLPARLLVAEDNAINQALIQALLGQLGISAEIVDRGAAVVERAIAAEAEGNPFDMVLMDVQMPDMDGTEAARRIREAGVTAEQLPIVALSANAYADDVRASLAAGMQAHLAKPIDVEKLTSTLRRWANLKLDETVLPDPDPALAPLCGQYRETLERVLRLATVAGRGDAGEGGDLEPLRLLCHQIAGTSAMFGHRALGDTARSVERAIGRDERDAAFVQTLALLRHRLRAALARELPLADGRAVG